MGFIDDIEVDTANSLVKTMIIYGRKSFFGFYPKESDIVIHCSEIKVIGSETILVSFSKNKSDISSDVENAAKSIKNKRFVYKNLFT